jgi:hypothetical protein
MDSKYQYSTQPGPTKPVQALATVRSLADTRAALTIVSELDRKGESIRSQAGVGSIGQSNSGLMWRTHLPGASAGNNHIAFSPTGLDRTIPQPELRKALEANPYLRQILSDCSATLERMLGRVGTPYIVRSSIEKDPEEERSRFVLRVISPGVPFDQKMKLWQEIAQALQESRSHAMTKIPLPRLKAREAWTDVIVHFDLE